MMRHWPVLSLLPLCRRPIPCGGCRWFKGYEKDIRSRAADITNAPSGGMAGSITAALFLKRFVSNTQAGCISISSPGRRRKSRIAPVGGEAQTIRALYRHLSMIG